MPEFRLPTTPEQWAAVKPNEMDIVCAERHMRMMNDGAEPYGPAVYAWAKGMAVARMLNHGRCVAALATHLFDGSESMSVARAEASRILEDK